MKLHILIFCFVAFTNVRCHVTNRTNVVMSTQFLEEKNRSEEISENKYGETKHPETEESRVYLDDVLFALKSLNWTTEEEPCLDDILRMLQSLQNFTLWAVWDWDTQSSEPQSLLFGNKYQLGNFDQCMNAPWAGTHPEVRTKYCLADIVLERTDKTRRPANKPKSQSNNPDDPYQSALDFIEYERPHSRPLNELTWGACVPESCQPRSVERLLGVMLARSHLGTAGMRADIVITEPCQTYDDHREFDGPFYAFMAMVFILTVISLICTYLNNRRKVSHPSGSTEDTVKNDFIKAFCLKENATDILRMNKNGIEVFYGIRFITMALIVLVHQIGLYNSGPISDGFTLDQVTRSALGLLILHDDIFVDTYFLLSGFLTATFVIKIKKLPNPLLIILKRYVRLVIALAVVVFYMCAVFPYTGYGPLWNRGVAHESDLCRKNWWANLIMLNNYIDTENICLVVTWYIPCDFHFFVVTILLYWVYKHLPRLGLLCGGLVAAASVIVPGVINYVYQLSAVQLFTFEFVSNPRGNREFHISYIKSHTRYASYLVGFYSGYLFLRYSAKGNFNRINKTWSVLGACAALILMLVVMVLGSTFLWHNYHPIVSALYAALNRPAWACCITLLVLCCSFGHVPLVKSLLSWYPWVPLSRLSYGLYLTHSIIITRNVFITRNPQHNDYFEIVIAATGVLVWGYVAALVLWLLAEAPASKLLTVCLKSRLNKLAPKENNIGSSPKTTVSTIPAGSDGHLQDNLPSTVHISSKI